MLTPKAIQHNTMQLTQDSHYSKTKWAVSGGTWTCNVRQTLYQLSYRGSSAGWVQITHTKHLNQSITQPGEFKHVHVYISHLSIVIFSKCSPNGTLRCKIIQLAIKEKHCHLRYIIYIRVYPGGAEDKCPPRIPVPPPKHMTAIPLLLMPNVPFKKKKKKALLQTSCALMPNVPLVETSVQLSTFYMYPLKEINYVCIKPKLRYM